MAELYIGTKFEGTDIDIADLEAFFKATKDLNFQTLSALFGKLTKVTVVEIKKSTTEVATIEETVLYVSQPPSP